jgi:hypothetical protein
LKQIYFDFARGEIIIESSLETCHISYKRDFDLAVAAIVLDKPSFEPVLAVKVVVVKHVNYGVVELAVSTLNHVRG